MSHTDSLPTNLNDISVDIHVSLYLFVILQKNEAKISFEMRIFRFQL